MEDLKVLFSKSGLTLNELSTMSGVSLSTTHRYVNNQIKEVKEEHYSPIYEVLKKYDTPESDMVDFPQEKEISKSNMDYLILQAERNMYKIFHEQFIESYRKHTE